MPTVREFFVSETRDCLVRLGRMLNDAQPDRTPDAGRLCALARTVRGSAQMAREDQVQRLARALELAFARLARGETAWNDAFRAAAIETVQDLDSMVDGEATAEVTTRLERALARWEGIAGASAPAGSAAAAPPTPVPASPPSAPAAAPPPPPAGPVARPSPPPPPPPAASPPPPPTPLEPAASPSPPTPPPPPPPRPSPPASPATGAVPIESLEYRGEAAVKRARELRPIIEAALAGQGDPRLALAALEELFDLLELARR